jgi:hypothetical protein
MSRTAFFATLLAGVAVAATAYAAQPAQTQAERACSEHGVQPRSPAWEICLSHVTRAYEWGEQGLANQLARAAGDARMNCLENGHRPGTQGYLACVNKEVEARSDLLILGDDQTGVNVASVQQ